MQKILLPLFTFALLATACHFSQSEFSENGKPESPENYITEEGVTEDSLKKIYLDELYFAGPGTNVDSIRHENWKQHYAIKMARRKEAGSRSVSEIFANGQLEATWHERGPNGEAGDMRQIDFDPLTEDFYAISTVGHLWKGNLNGSAWTKLNDDIRFMTDEIEILPHNGSVRIFAAYGSGVDNKKIRFSDDQGQTWTTGAGFSFYDHWGKGRRLYTLSDNQTLYYLVHTWSQNPWGELIQLYKSTDKGLNYTKVWDTPVGYKVEDVDLWKPYGSDQMFLVDNRAQQYYEVSHDFGTGGTTITPGVSYASQGVISGAMHLSGRFNNATNDYDLFMIRDAGEQLYKSSNGSTWTYLSTAPENVWQKGWLADPDNSNLYIGGFQLNKSTNGVNWVEQYPQWWRYYSHSKDSLHVDIMNFDYFKKSNGTPFIIVLDHAGVHVTYDHFATTANLGLNSLNVVTLYDQSTAGDGFLYCGAQDKGNFVYNGNSVANFDQISTSNSTTGDGMLGAFFNSDQSIYAMIQNGTILCLPNRATKSYYSFDIPGSNKPGWINPIVSTPAFSDNKAYVAGGNLNGGTGSYLILVNVTLSGGFSWQNTQYNYDFRANSNNGTSVIKAIGVSNSNTNRLYVATQDATFFASTNQGSSWLKKTNAGLPSTMIPWDIKCSKTNPDKVYICGTGFSNTGVYESLNGGNTFSPLSGGIPGATFYEVELSDDEEMLFAATSAGPYVYIFDENQWHNLIGMDTPLCDFNTVNNLGNNIIRFGTYGRGVWDLEITNIALPIELASFTAQPWQQSKTRLNWTAASESDIREFQVEHSTDGVDFQPIGNVPSQGNSTSGHNYPFVHNDPVRGDNYYRLRIVENDGKFYYSPVVVVHFDAIAAGFSVYPNSIAQNGQIQIDPGKNEQCRFELYSAGGQKVIDRQLSGISTQAMNLPKGIYVYRVGEGQWYDVGRIVVW